MNDLITLKEYAEFVGAPFRTVQTRARQGQIPTVKIGSSVKIEKSTPWLDRSANIRKAKEDRKVAANPKYKIEITRAYYVAVCDNSGKEVVSDFTFLSKAEAEKLGAKMKKEVEGKI